MAFVVKKKKGSLPSIETIVGEFKYIELRVLRNRYRTKADIDSSKEEIRYFRMRQNANASVFCDAMWTRAGYQAEFKAPVSYDISTQPQKRSSIIALLSKNVNSF